MLLSHVGLLVPESLLRWAEPPEAMQILCLLVPKALPLFDVEGYPPSLLWFVPGSKQDSSA